MSRLRTPTGWKDTCLVSKEEGEQQCSYMRSINISISQYDNFLIAKCILAELLPLAVPLRCPREQQALGCYIFWRFSSENTNITKHRELNPSLLHQKVRKGWKYLHTKPKRKNQVLNFLVLVDSSIILALYVQNLSPQWQNGLKPSQVHITLENSYYILASLNWVPCLTNTMLAVVYLQELLETKQLLTCATGDNNYTHSPETCGLDPAWHSPLLNLLLQWRSLLV